MSAEAEQQIQRVHELADEWERKADALAITYQRADHRAIATGPWRQAVAELRALLNEGEGQ